MRPRLLVGSRGRHLVGLGFAKASDVIGGYAAWRNAGLVTAPAPRRRRGELAGMRPADPQ